MRWPWQRKVTGPTVALRARPVPSAMVELTVERGGEPVYSVRLTVANADRLADDLMKAAGEAAMGSTRALRPWEG